MEARAAGQLDSTRQHTVPLAFGRQSVVVLSRSEVMSRIKSRDSRPEMALRSALHANGLRYRLQGRVEGTRVDIIFARERVAVFVDGCFWHGCPMHYSAPAREFDFWQAKLRANVVRDRAASIALAQAGWGVVRVWQHELRDLKSVIAKVESAMRSTSSVDGGSPRTSRVAAAPLASGNAPWWTCSCGGQDVRVIAASGPGSLRPNAVKLPSSVSLMCWSCGREWSIKRCGN